MTITFFRISLGWKDNHTVFVWAFSSCWIVLDYHQVYSLCCWNMGGVCNLWGRGLGSASPEEVEQQEGMERFEGEIHFSQGACVEWGRSLKEKKTRTPFNPTPPDFSTLQSVLIHPLTDSSLIRRCYHSSPCSSTQTRLTLSCRERQYTDLYRFTDGCIWMLDDFYTKAQRDRRIERTREIKLEGVYVKMKLNSVLHIYLQVTEWSTARRPGHVFLLSFSFFSSPSIQKETKNIYNSW